MSDKEGFDRDEHIWLTKIAWAHDRELTLAALLLASGIGAFEVLEKVKNFCILGILYTLLFGFIVFGIYLLFKFELVILQNQSLLEHRRHWTFTYGTILKAFFIRDGEKVNINYITLAFLQFAVLVIGFLLFIGVKAPELILLLRKIILGI